jgi:hypothetical protein
VTRRSVAPTPRAVAAKTAEAADTLVAWLQTQPPAASGRFLAVTATASDPSNADGADTVRAQSASADATSLSPPSRAALATTDLVGMAVPSLEVTELSGAPGAVPTQDTGSRCQPAPLRLAHTDWLHHRLSVVGPEAVLADFRVAAAGSGTVPWYLDLDRVAEDIFHLLVAPPTRSGSLVPPVRTLSLTGARILADQLCAAAARRHALAVARVGHSLACPFDLHALIPVPNSVLRSGPDSPAALDWLWAHWGTTQPLRHVEEVVVGATLRERSVAGEGAWAVAFWSADWTPWRALAQMTARWPGLRFGMRPLYNTQ